MVENFEKESESPKIQAKLDVGTIQNSDGKIIIKDNKTGATITGHIDPSGKVENANIRKSGDSTFSINIKSEDGKDGYNLTMTREDENGQMQLIEMPKMSSQAIDAFMKEVGMHDPWRNFCNPPESQKKETSKRSTEEELKKTGGILY